MKKELVILIVIIVLITIYYANKYNVVEKLKNIYNAKNNKIEPPINIKSDLSNFSNGKKMIQYFGGDYCPFSNNTSNAYKVVKDFEEVYGEEVSVKYYWVGQNDDIMKELNVQYVPTILNGNNDVIELSLPENIDTKDLSNEELKDMLLETIYNKL
jgi:thioredoxin-related protein